MGKGVEIITERTSEIIIQPYITHISSQIRNRKCGVYISYSPYDNYGEIRRGRWPTINHS